MRTVSDAWMPSLLKLNIVRELIRYCRPRSSPGRTNFIGTMGPGERAGASDNGTRRCGGNWVFSHRRNAASKTWIGLSCDAVNNDENFRIFILRESRNRAGSRSCSKLITQNIFVLFWVVRVGLVELVAEAETVPDTKLKGTSLLASSSIILTEVSQNVKSCYSGFDVEIGNSSRIVAHGL